MTTKPQKIEGGKKDCMFQYGTKLKMIENTDLITRQEAEDLKDKYLEDIKERWNDMESPEMCIWIDCDTATSYHTQGFDIDYRDCNLENGYFYKVTKTRIL